MDTPQQIQWVEQPEEKKSKRIAAFFTLGYVLVILAILFLWKLKAEAPMEEDGGLMVDFGYTDVGMGDEEPSKDNEMNKVAIPSPGNPPFTQEVTEDVLVQDEEVTENIDVSVKKESKKVVVVENVLKKITPSTNISKNSTETSKEVSQTEQKPNTNAMFTGFKGTGSGSGSQGNKAGEGNMGDPSGSKSDNYLGQNTGLGSEGKGSGKISSGLIGRKLNGIPDIVDQSNKTGKIIIRVKVDATGKVIESTFVTLGSTITDSDLISKCTQAAKKAKFTPNEDKDVDYGNLVFNFAVR